MVIVRGTRTFRDRVGSAREPDTPSTTKLGDWFATVMFWRPQVALFVNATTLLPVVTTFAPAANVLSRFPDALAAVLVALGVAQPVIEHEVAQASETLLAKTNSRSVVGVMNEFVHLADVRRGVITGPADLLPLSLELAATPCGPLYGSYGSPDRAVVAALAGSVPISPGSGPGGSAYEAGQ